MAINKRTKRKQVSGHKKTKWSKDEDELLLNNIKKYLEKHTNIDWTKVVISTRNSKQCQERYKNQLHPNINKSKFSEKEINIIIENKKYAFCHPIPKIEKIFIKKPNKIGDNIPCG